MIVPIELQEKTYNLDKDREETFVNSKHNYVINKKRVDKNRTEYTFRENELVYIENGNKLNSLQVR